MMNKVKYIMVAMLACVGLAMNAQEADDDADAPVVWFLDEVINDAFVKECSFDYYYTPSASDMLQQRARGEVSYFLNSPPGLNRKRVCTLIDGIMESQDEVMAMNDWQTTSTTCWKEFSRERNKFRVSVKNAALDDGTYYVSVTETANCYKHPAKREKKEKTAAPTTKRAKRINDRKPVVVPDKSKADDEEDPATVDEQETDEEIEDVNVQEPLVSKREREQAKRLEKEKQRQQAQAEKEAEKQRRAEEKKAKQEQQAQLKEQERLKKEQEKQLKEEERQRQAAERKQQALAREEQKKERQRQAEYNASKYHYSDVALWLSDKYDFTQTAGGENSITMYSIAVKDVEMAKLTIKNALKGSNARMAMPWRVNSQDGSTIETGYSVDGHVLVFAIGNNDAGNITLTITEMDNDEFETFRQGGLL